MSMNQSGSKSIKHKMISSYQGLSNPKLDEQFLL